MGLLSNMQKQMQDARARQPITSKSPGEQFAAAGDQTLARADAATADAGASRTGLLAQLTGGQDMFNTSARAAVDAAMPSFQGALQGVRESAIRRGVNVGQLGTSYEGDLASAFQRNISNSIAGQALNLWGQQADGLQSLHGMDLGRADAEQTRYLDVLTARGDWDRLNAEQNRKKKKGLGGMIGGAIGGVGGFLLGGPAGAIAGAKAGSGIGSSIGGGGY